MVLVGGLVVADAGLDAAWLPGRCVAVVAGKLGEAAVELVGGSMGTLWDGPLHSLHGLWW